MWRSGVVGAFFGWTAIVVVAAGLLSQTLLEAGVFGEACREFAPRAFTCALPAKLLFGFGSLPHYVFGGLTLPFVYDPDRDSDGYGIASLVVLTPIAYAMLLVAANHWLWSLRELLAPR
jgi:hypothetical protein